jgi:hypothetical protein
MFLAALVAHSPNRKEKNELGYVEEDARETSHKT